MKRQLPIEKNGKLIAIISFGIGTFMLLIYFLTMSTEFAFFSYYLLVILFTTNFITLIILFIRLYQKKERKIGILKTIGILLLNIPIAIIYFYIVASLTNIIRLTITNKTNSPIKNLIIKGCEEKQIKLLNNNESTTVWIKIPNDCSIYAQYQINGKTKNEQIFGYVTNMMGQKAKYEIGVNKNSLDSEF